MRHVCRAWEGVGRGKTKTDQNGASCHVLVSHTCCVHACVSVCMHMHSYVYIYIGLSALV